MYDPVTLDQLRALITVVEAGSFSAAARKLQRVQSAVSTAMANLEQQLGVQVWDRSTRVATLTEPGKAVVGAARRVLTEVDGLRRLAGGLSEGLEASVSLCIDALFPLDALIALCTGFAEAFPQVALRIDTEVLAAVSARVLSGGASLGVISPTGMAAGLERRTLATVCMVPVVSPAHPLARVRGKVPTAQLAEAVQVVLSERGAAQVADQAVLATRTHRVADLHTKHAMLRAGLGWGNLPEHLVRDDLRTKRLVRLRPEGWRDDEHALVLSAIHRRDAVLGPAQRWLLDQLAATCAQAVAPAPRKQRR